MGVFGGSRVDRVTFSVFFTLIIYSFLVSGVVATYTSVEWSNPASSINTDIAFGESYEYSDYANVSEPVFPMYLGVEASLEDLNPDGFVTWLNPLFSGDKLEISRGGRDWWNSVFRENLQQDITSFEDILNNYDFDKNYTKISCDIGGELESYVFVKPLSYYNETSGEFTHIYDDLSQSYGNGSITVIMATNATYPNYDMWNIVSMLGAFGYESHGIPSEIGLLTSALFYGMVTILIVKLVIG